MNSFPCPFEKKHPSELLRDEAYYMSLAYNLALEAFKAGEVPVGAVIVRSGEVIASARNQVEGLKDATAHAEMLAITAAAKHINDWRLEGCTLFVTKEPCPMCAGALLLSRIERVVFATPDPKMGGLGGVLEIHHLKESFHRFEAVQFTQEPLASDSTQMLRAFFAGRRTPAE